MGHWLTLRRGLLLGGVPPTLILSTILTHGGTTLDALLPSPSRAPLTIHPHAGLNSLYYWWWLVLHCSTITLVTHAQLTYLVTLPLRHPVQRHKRKLVVVAESDSSHTNYFIDCGRNISNHRRWQLLKCTLKFVVWSLQGIWFRSGMEGEMKVMWHV